MSGNDEMFIGWSPTAPKADRRFMLGAGLALLAGAGLAGAASGMRGLPAGPGSWDQDDVRDWVGVLLREPYPMLLLPGEGQTPRIALLATSGKLGVDLPDGLDGTVVVRGSPIARGDLLMIATDSTSEWIRSSPAQFRLAGAPEEDLGEMMLGGEILDAKCWFGAMRPGFGKTHKSCAELCALGRLPLAFCEAGSCGDALDAPLFLDQDGRAYGPELLPFVGDPVIAMGRRVRFAGLTQFRVALQDIRRR